MFVRIKPAVCVITILGANLAPGLCPITHAQPPTYTIDQGVALADGQNPDILIARKKLEAARAD